MSELIKTTIQKGVNYQNYKNFFEELVADGKTSGPNQSEMYVHYTKLNLSRTNRVEKKLKLSTDTLAALHQPHDPQYWILITEPWCGDAAQSVPVIQAMAQANPNVELVIVYRDDNKELMNKYLTDGGTAIPIVVFVSQSEMAALGHWGPRPADAQKIMTAYKALPDTQKPPYTELAETMQKWYNVNKTVDTQKEFISTWSKTLKH